MLPADRRLVDGSSYAHAVRRGQRAGSRTLVLHLCRDDDGASSLSRAGFVVSKAVGNAVVRNRVKRRLRHLVGARLDLLPAGSDLVVRALPAASGSTAEELGDDLDRCLTRVGAGPAGTRSA